MRHLFVAALFGSAVAGAACGQDKKAGTDPEPKPAAAKLGVGDAAPALKVTKWLQGEEVKAFAKDKVYVVEFWATWCGPCIKAMPHLNELAQEYKAKGLEVIGFTCRDILGQPGNSQAAVEEFVTKNGKKFNYRFAYSDDRDTDKTYMEASGQEGIPCSFVIGKDGKIAFIGHPMELDDVLPLVLDGKWEGKKSIDALAATRNELEDAVAAGEKDPAKGMQGLTAFVAKHPEYATRDQFLVQRMLFTMRAKQFDDAKVQAEAMIALSDKNKKPQAAAFAGILLSKKDLNPDKKHLDTAVKAIDFALKLEPKDYGLALAAIDVYLAAGKTEAAAAAGKLAQDATTGEDPKVVAQVQKMVKEKMEKK